MQTEMLYFSSLLKTNPTYKPAADNLFAALDFFHIKYKFIFNTKDIWMRDFMPIKTRTGKYISFQYKPSYLYNYPEIRTDYQRGIAHEQGLSAITYSDINLDGGNVVFSPSKQKVIISDRIFSENPKYTALELTEKLEKILEAQVIIIPALPARYDMTGHADGMVRFLDENTVLGNRVSGTNTLEQQITSVLQHHAINTIEFPYFDSRGISAEGCYLNYLETDAHIFLPVFKSKMDVEAVDMATSIFSKTIVPVSVSAVAKQGGVLNCISWEN